jgi:hypothetical protein
MYNPYDSSARLFYELAIQAKIGQGLKAHYDLLLPVPTSLLALLMQLNEGPEEEPVGEADRTSPNASDDLLM